MKNRINRVVRWMGGGTVIAMAAVVASVPFNMGGCVQDIGAAIGGPTGALIQGAGQMAESQMIDERHEDKYGQTVAVAVTNTYGYYDDEKLNHYVNLVGLTVVSGSDRPDGNFVFGVVNSDEIGAFSGPGGYIMITRGALQQIENEAELAGVLAHEIGHVCLQHGLKAVKSSNFTQGLITAANSQNDAENQQAFNAVSSALVESVGQEFSKEDETEADTAAIKYLIATNYNPSAYVNFLRKLESGHKQMKTHPASAQRIAHVEQLIEKAGKTNQGQTLKARYAMNVTR